MFDKLPSDRQNVEVRFDNRDWQPAMYVDGEFVDAYGMPLDSGRISSWRAPNGTPHNYSRRKRQVDAGYSSDASPELADRPPRSEAESKDCFRPRCIFWRAAISG